MNRPLIILLILLTLSGCGKGMTLFDYTTSQDQIIRSAPIYNMVIFVNNWPEEQRFLLQEELQNQLRVFGMKTQFYYDIQPSALVNTSHDSTELKNLMLAGKYDAVLFVKQVYDVYEVGELQGPSNSNGQNKYDTTSTPNYTPDINDIHNNTVPVKIFMPNMTIETRLYKLDSTYLQGQIIWAGRSVTKQVEKDEKKIKSYVRVLMDEWYTAYIVPPVRNIEGQQLQPQSYNE